MTSFLDQLNLTPQERRIVVAIAVIVFGVLNLLLVWPHFKDLKVVRKELADTRESIQKEDKEILKDVDPSSNGYKNVLKQLERQQGGGVVNQQVQLQRTVSDQAIKTGVSVDELRPMGSSRSDTNRFYDEQSVKISFQCQEVQLVNFLYNVGNDPAMIRVQELNLKTADANRYMLKGDAVLTANYAKQPGPGAAKTTAAPAPGRNVPAANPPSAPPGTPQKQLAPRIPLVPKLAPAAQTPRKNL